MDRAIQKFNRGMVGISVVFFGALITWLALTADADFPYFNVGFTASWIVSCLAIYGTLAYAKRRPVGKSLSWGEAMAGATIIFALMFWVYGVVPHLWLTFSDSELSWRVSRSLEGPTLPSWWSSDRQGILSWALPFNLNYQVVRDIVAVVIYAIALFGNLALFSIWQKRGLPAPDETEDTLSKYGRPLVRGAKQP